MPAPRLFRIAILCEGFIFLAYLACSLLGYDQLPKPVRDQALDQVMSDLDHAIWLFGSSILEFIFLLTALTGLYFYGRFARKLWWIAMALSAAELLLHPVISERGWISAIGGLSYLGYGLITGLLWHPEIRTRFNDHSTKGRRRLKIALAVAGIMALLAVGIGGLAVSRVLRTLPPGKATPIPKEIALNQASPPRDILASLESITDTYLATSANAGIAVGITRGRGSERVFVTHGVLEKHRDGSGAPVTADTLFEIGSVSKTFTALLAAEAVADGVIRLDQPVSEVLGDLATLPLVEEQPITFLDLATHHTGFPKMPGNLSVGRQFAANPYANYSDADLYAAVSALGSNQDNGDPRRRRYRYSNLGFSLLAHSVALASKQSLGDLHADLFARLGMTNTYFTLPETARDRLATGHNRGLHVGHWHDGGSLIQGAGSLVSSVADQLTWLETHLDPPDAADGGSLGEAMKLVSQPRLRAQGENVRIGLGWHFTGNKAPIIWHNGATGGFSSIILWFPNPKLGVVVLGNSSDDAVDRIGFLLMRSLLQKEGGTANGNSDSP